MTALVSRNSEAPLAVFAAVTRLLVAAEWRGIAHRIVWHVAGPHLEWQPWRARDRALHVGGEAVDRIVGDGCFFLILVGRMDRTGPKISSRAIVMSFLTPANTVGRTK
jgi:hypothetical protein